MSEPEYFFEKAPTDNEAFFSFKGHFQQVSVTWHVHLLTCQSRNHQSATQQDVFRQFIDIEKSRQAGHYHAQICLNIPKISNAAIMKTIIMIRQYKNLATGRHEYGEPVQLSVDI
jgi:hypothetical protein